MSEEKPSPKGIIIKGNTFERVGTAAQINGRVDIAYEDNVHIDTQRGLVASNEPAVADSEITKSSHYRASEGWIKPITVAAIGGFAAIALGLFFFGVS